jgi:hypothetical protein
VWKPLRVQARSTRLAMVDLPEPDSPVNHRQRGVWPLIRWRARGGRPPDAASGCCWRGAVRNQRAAGDGGVGLAVDQDEGAERAVVGIALERDWRVERQVAVADFVELEALAPPGAPGC